MKPVKNSPPQRPSERASAGAIFNGLKKFIAVTAFVVVVAPFAAGALTIADLQAQFSAIQQKLQALVAPQASTNANVNSAISRHRICDTLPIRSLRAGLRGDDVVSLQEFLRSEGYFSASATGYYGPLTAQAVARWQASQGISAVGIVGPLSRERIRVWCGGQGGGGVVTPSDPSADPRCKSWYDGCNNCSREYPGGPAACTLRACFQQAPAYCISYFDGTNRPPVISGFSGPTTLTLNEQGTWSIQASDPENGPLTYSIRWGDEWFAGNAAPQTSAENSIVQTTTFTHSYSAAGTYTISVVVSDNAGAQARTTTTVNVDRNLVACTMEYAPVCGQPPEPACRRIPPYCMLPTPAPQTYGNRCMLNAAGATLLYEGACTTY